MSLKRVTGVGTQAMATQCGLRKAALLLTTICLGALSLVALGGVGGRAQAGEATPGLTLSSSTGGGTVDYGEVGIGDDMGVTPPFSGTGGIVLGDTDSTTVTVDLSTGVAYTGADPNDWVLTPLRSSDPNPCQGTGTQVILPSNTSCNLTITFSPGALGPRSATLMITGSDGSTASIDLTGTGVPTLSLMASNVNFGGVTLGTVVGPTPGDVTSLGTVTIQSAPGRLSNTIDLAKDLSFSGPGADDYVVTPGTCNEDGSNIITPPALLRRAAPVAVLHARRRLPPRRPR